jgi:hypothetical protein
MAVKNKCKTVENTREPNGQKKFPLTFFSKSWRRRRQNIAPRRSLSRNDDRLRTSTPLHALGMRAISTRRLLQLSQTRYASIASSTPRHGLWLQPSSLFNGALIPRASLNSQPCQSSREFHHSSRLNGLNGLGIRHRHDSTIFALSTAPGRAAIAIIRLSGPACLEVCSKLPQTSTEDLH